MIKFSEIIKSLVITLVLAMLSIGVFIYSGLYPIGADQPHNKITYWLLESLRENSIARSAKNIEIPDNLNSADRLLAGGADYHAMCSGCHLKPGKSDSDLSIGLYPSPPNLTKFSESTQKTLNDTSALQRQFWIIKHGIKASGMPAWGATHVDERIWNMVAFINRLPSLTEDQYQILTSITK